MHKIVYHISVEQKDDEIEWLRDQKIFPAIQEAYNWDTGKIYIRVGVIVGAEAALTIKLRHKLDLQLDYRQR